MRIEFVDIAEEIYKTGKEYAKAKSHYEMLAESRKSVIAKVASEQEGSETKRERLARSSDEYKQYLVGTQQARQLELELKYKIDSLQAQFEYCRSMNSVKKREMNII